MNRRDLVKAAAAAPLAAIPAIAPAEESELDSERVRLAACGVAAMQNTRDAIEQRIGPDNPYWSASYRAVCDAVDREMKYRDEYQVMVHEFIGWLSGDIPELHGVEVPRLADSWHRFQVQQILSRRDS